MARHELPAIVAGQTFGQWTVTGEAPRHPQRHRQAYAVCDCDHHTQHVVMWSHLVHGMSTRCRDCNRRYQPVIRYTSAHQRVSRERGPAWYYLCDEGCGNQADQWSWILYTFWLMETEGSRAFIPYSPDPWDYRPLCNVCHKRFDRELMVEWWANEPGLIRMNTQGGSRTRA